MFKGYQGGFFEFAAAVSGDLTIRCGTRERVPCAEIRCARHVPDKAESFVDQCRERRSAFRSCRRSSTCSVSNADFAQRSSLTARLRPKAATILHATQGISRRRHIASQRDYIRIPQGYVSLSGNPPDKCRARSDKTKRARDLHLLVVICP